MKGALYGDTRIVSLLSKRDHDLSVVDDYGENVFHCIVWFNDDDVSLEMLNLLDATQISSDVVNQQNKFENNTPLHDAAVKKNHKTIAWLLEYGAYQLNKDIDGERPNKDDDHNCDDETKC